MKIKKTKNVTFDVGLLHMSPLLHLSLGVITFVVKKVLILEAHKYLLHPIDKGNINYEL